jgi:hypothetical protein
MSEENKINEQNMITNEDLKTNKKWKKYFLFTFIFPPLSLLFITGALYLTLILFYHSHPQYSGDTAAAVLAFMSGSTIIRATYIITIMTLIYTIWFIIASQYFFKLFKINKYIGFCVNFAGIYFGGISFLILPLFFLYKIKKYWNLNNKKSSFYGSLKN